MKLHVVTPYEQPAEVVEGMAAAKTVAEAEAADAAFFRLDDRLRRAWIEREAGELGMDPSGYQLATPALRLL